MAACGDRGAGDAPPRLIRRSRAPRLVGIAHSGPIAVGHEDDTEVEIGLGQAYMIEPGTTPGSWATQRFVG